MCASTRVAPNPGRGTRGCNTSRPYTDICAGQGRVLLRIRSARMRSKGPPRPFEQDGCYFHMSGIVANHCSKPPKPQRIKQATPQIITPIMPQSITPALPPRITQTSLQRITLARKTKKTLQEQGCNRHHTTYSFMISLLILMTTNAATVTATAVTATIP